MRFLPSVSFVPCFFSVLALALTQTACVGNDVPAEMTIHGAPGLSSGALVPVIRPAKEALPQQPTAITPTNSLNRSFVVATQLAAAGRVMMPRAAAPTTPASEAPAEMCALELITSVQMEPMSGGTMLAPVMIDNVPKFMLVDTGGLTSQLWASTAQAFHFPEQKGNLDLVDIDGNISNKMVRVASFRLGALHNQDIDFQIYPDRSVTLGNGRIAGLLAPDLFAAYDLDLDFGTGRMNYFSQDHCAGKVQYWPAVTVAAIPFSMRSGHISIPVTIEGHRLTAILDTGASNTIMTMDAAKEVFGLDPEAGMESVGVMAGGTPIYRHVFANMSFEGVSVRNPRILLMPDMTGKPTNSDGNLPDIIVGMDLIKNLHMYIAFKENKIFVSQASTPEKR